MTRGCWREVVVLRRNSGGDAGDGGLGWGLRAGVHSGGGAMTTATEIRCPQCWALIIEMASPPIKATCRRCGAKFEVKA